MYGTLEENENFVRQAVYRAPSFDARASARTKPASSVPRETSAARFVGTS